MIAEISEPSTTIDQQLADRVEPPRPGGPRLGHERAVSTIAASPTGTLIQKTARQPIA